MDGEDRVKIPLQEPQRQEKVRFEGGVEGVEEGEAMGKRYQRNLKNRDGC